MPTTTTEQQPDEGATHRLQRIIVQEVSLVDRAANKRRFLVVKRDETMANAGKPVKKEDAAAATANVAENAANEGGEGAGGAPAPSGSGMQQQVKEALTKALADAAEKIVALANEVDKIEVTDQPVEPAVPSEITTQIGACAKLLGEIAAKFGGAPAGEGVTAGEGSNDQPAPNVTGEGGTPAAAKSADEEEPTEAEKSAVEESEEEVAQKGLEVAKHRDLVTKSVAKRLGLQLDAAQVVVAKVGRRMAKKRLEQLGKAIDMLISLMKELRYEGDKAAAAAKAKAQQATQKSAGAPSVAPSEIEALITSTEQVIEIAKAKTDTLAKTQAALDEANARIAKLEKQTAGSNAIPLEKSGSAKTGGSVSWPIFDMNGK